MNNDKLSKKKISETKKFLDQLLADMELMKKADRTPDEIIKSVTKDFENFENTD